MNYPKIDRSLVDYTSTPDVLNIGYHEGTFKDGRPYRIEVWVTGNITTATLFISQIDLEDKSDIDLVKYISGENIINFNDDRVVVNNYTDSDDNMFYSINIPLVENGTDLNKLEVALTDYDIY